MTNNGKGGNKGVDIRLQLYDSFLERCGGNPIAAACMVLSQNVWAVVMELRKHNERESGHPQNRPGNGPLRNRIGPKGLGDTVASPRPRQ